MIKYSPIVLFVYNRPDHSRKTLESLMANHLAGESRLFIFCDGPKANASQEDILRISEVRKVIREKNWCGEVTIIESEFNSGLANSIISGVTRIVNEFGYIIVLEDDLITSPFFLHYMNDALTKYMNDEKVMQICGYMFPIINKNLKETFFLRLSSSWGWGTWKRAWKYFEEDVDALYENFPKELKNSFNLDGAYDYYSFFKAQQDKKVDSWAIRWYASIFLRNGLCLHPANSLIFNNGNDNSGVHSGSTDFFDTVLSGDKVMYYEAAIQEDPEALERIKSFFLKQSERFPGNTNYMRRILKKLGF
jgi:hypothetical protein